MKKRLKIFISSLTSLLIESPGLRRLCMYYKQFLVILRISIRKIFLILKKKKRKVFVVLHKKYQENKYLKILFSLFLHTYPIYFYFFFVINAQDNLTIIYGYYYCYWVYFCICKWVMASELFANPKRPKRHLQMLDMIALLIFLSWCPMIVYYIAYLPYFDYFHQL